MMAWFRRMLRLDVRPEITPETYDALESVVKRQTAAQRRIDAVAAQVRVVTRR